MTPEEYIDKMAFMTAGDNYAVMYEDARKAVNMAKSTWIKVDDGLPEDGKYVLILIKYKDEYQIHKYIRFSNDTLETWKFTNDSKIIAWMEIPSYEHIIKDK